MGRGRIAATLAMALVMAGCATTGQGLPGSQAVDAAPLPVATADYHIAPDDVLRIKVYHEPDLSLEDARVNAAGAVRLPLVGDVPVAGLTADESADRIAARLGQRYLVSPQVTIFVKEAVGRRFTIDGEVRQPGRYQIDGRLGLADAVAMAKGATRLAGLGEVIIVRQVDGQQQAARFDLGAIRKGRSEDPQIMPGDRIFVGLSRLKAALGGALIAIPVLSAGFIALDGR